MEKLRGLAFWSGPHTLQRYGPAFIVWHGLMFLVGFMFWRDAAQTEISLFRETTWGAVAYSQKAEVWAAINMVASTLSVIGLVDRPRRYFAVVGGVLNVAQYFVLSYSAAFTGGDPAVALYVSLLLMPINLLVLLGIVCEWRR